MYLRFVLPTIDPDAHVRTGPFDVAIALRDDERAPWWWREELYEALAWLNEHLPAPTRFDDKWSEPYAGVCWLREDSHACLERLWTIAVALRELGVPVDFLVTDDPGRVVYRDEHQVVAVPRPWTRC